MRSTIKEKSAKTIKQQNVKEKENERVMNDEIKKVKVKNDIKKEEEEEEEEEDVVPFTDCLATPKLNKSRKEMVTELRESYYPMNPLSKMLAIVLVCGSLKHSKNDWVAIALDVSEHAKAKVLELREAAKTKKTEEDEDKDDEVPLEIVEGAKMREIDARSIMDYLIFDRGFLLPGEEEEEEEDNVGEARRKRDVAENANATPLLKKYRMNEEKMKRSEPLRKAIDDISKWIAVGEKSSKFYPIKSVNEEDSPLFSTIDEDVVEEEEDFVATTPNFEGGTTLNEKYSDEDEDIIGTTMCKRRRENTPATARTIDKSKVSSLFHPGRRTTISFNIDGNNQKDEESLSPFCIHGRQQQPITGSSAGKVLIEGGVKYLCDKIRRNPGATYLEISHFAAEQIIRELRELKKGITMKREQKQKKNKSRLGSNTER